MFNYFELEMHFDPEELPVDLLSIEIDKLRSQDSYVEFSEIEGYTSKCLRIRWTYES